MNSSSATFHRMRWLGKRTASFPTRAYELSIGRTGTGHSASNSLTLKRDFRLKSSRVSRRRRSRGQAFIDHLAGKTEIGIDYNLRQASLRVAPLRNACVRAKALKESIGLFFAYVVHGCRPRQFDLDGQPIDFFDAFIRDSNVPRSVPAVNSRNTHLQGSANLYHQQVPQIAEFSELPGKPRCCARAFSATQSWDSSRSRTASSTRD